MVPPLEAQLHINALELLAVSFGLKALCSSEHHYHIKALSDNTTTVTYLRNMGDLTASLVTILPGKYSSGVRTERSGLHQRISLVLRTQKLILLLEYLMTRQSGNLIHKDWQIFLPSLVALSLIYLHLDLITNYRVMYLVEVDAFTLDWGTQYNYAFQPFSLIPQVLQKLEEDQADMFLVAPHWPTQFWFPKLTRLLVKNPVLLPSQPNILHLPFNQGKAHPLRERLLLRAWHLSGKVSETKAYWRELKKSSLSPGGKGPKTVPDLITEEDFILQ